MACLFQQIPLIADVMPKLNQKIHTIHGRIINRSEYQEVMFELAGDKKNERALKMINGNAKTKPKIRWIFEDGCLTLPDARSPLNPKAAQLNCSCTANRSVQFAEFQVLGSLQCSSVCESSGQRPVQCSSVGLSCLARNEVVRSC